MTAFYVTQVRDRKFRKVAGPFDTREEAEQAVQPARRKVCAADPWSDFDAFGVARLDQSRLPRIRDQ